MNPDSGTQVFFRVLGNLTVETPGARVALGGLRQAKLLATLLIDHDHHVGFDRIVDCLWETPPRSARQQVHNAVGSLRRAFAGIGAVELVTVESGYQLRVPRECVDLHQFQDHLRESVERETRGLLAEAVAELTHALALRHGPALSGLDGRYLEGVAAQLEEQHLAATERLMALRLRLGAGGSLIHELLGLIAEYPLRESLRASLMLALYQCDRQADALAAYQDARRLLGEELGLDPSPGLQALHSQILRGVPVGDITARDADGARTTVASDTAPSVVRSLPRVPREFVGRGAELARLRSHVTGTGSSPLSIIVIDGMAGAGKTTVALRLAHRLAERFRDGQYFLNLHGFSLGRAPVRPEQALAALLCETGVPAELLPSSLESRERLWRTRMANKRALVVLDNIRDEAQVRPLIPGAPDTLVVVTSRRKLTALEGSLPLRLDVLPRRDAVTLFIDIVGPERVADDLAAVGHVVDLCGRHPLAIRIAAARFRDRESWTMNDLLTQLIPHERRIRFLTVGDRDVMAELRLSYHNLPKLEKLVFRLLSFHRGSHFDAVSVAALCGSSVEQAEMRLDTLFEHGLLLQTSPQRYELHELVRDCSKMVCHENR